MVIVIDNICNVIDVILSITIFAIDNIMLSALFVVKNTLQSCKSKIRIIGVVVLLVFCAVVCLDHLKNDFFDDEITCTPPTQKHTMKRGGCYRSSESGLERRTEHSKDGVDRFLRCPQDPLFPNLIFVVFVVQNFTSKSCYR